MKITHDPKRQEFGAQAGQYRAVLMYSRKGKILDFYHIYVPDPARRQGLAGRILMEAFDYARAQGFRVVPTCPFIAGDFLPRFPQYRDLVEPGEFVFDKE